MRKLLSGLWLLALLGTASAQTLGPGASGPCSVFGTTAGTCAQGSAAVPYTGATGTVNLGGNQLNNVIIGTTTPLAGAFTTVNSTSGITINNVAATLTFQNGVGGGSVPLGQIAQSGSTGQITWATIGSFGVFLTVDYTTGATAFSGDFVTTTGTPTIASGACGTGSNGTITGDNQSGVITVGAVATTSCVVTFSKTLFTAPKACIAFPANATAAGATILAHIDTIAATGFTLAGAVLASTKFNFHCY